MSARALGALVKGMGEEHFEDLLPWLMETLTSENSSVDRSGAAQGNLMVGRPHKTIPPKITATDPRQGPTTAYRPYNLFIFSLSLSLPVQVSVKSCMVWARSVWTN